MVLRLGGFFSSLRFTLLNLTQNKIMSPNTSNTSRLVDHDHESN